MKRREAIIGSALLAGLSTDGVLAQGGKKRLGDVIIPPAEEMGKEKHVPYIDAPSSVKANEQFMVTVEVGRTVPHPNTTEHYIKWIQLYAIAEDSRYVVHLGSFEFCPARVHPKVTVPVMLERNSTLYALEHCNIHGLWDNSVDVKVV